MSRPTNPVISQSCALAVLAAKIAASSSVDCRIERSSEAREAAFDEVAFLKTHIKLVVAVDKVGALARLPSLLVV